MLKSNKENQTLVNDAMANNPMMEPIYGGEVLTHNTGLYDYISDIISLIFHNTLIYDFTFHNFFLNN